MSRIELGTTVNRTAITAAALLLLAGCAGEQPSSRASVEIRGTSPSATASATTARRSAKGGVVAYDGYEAAVAHDGDTVSSVADRIGLSASELGAYNGLAPDHPLRDGDELVLPPRPGGYGAARAAPAPTESYASTYTAPPPVGTAPGTELATIETAPLDGTAGTAFPSAAPTGQDSAASWSPDLAAAAINRAASPIDTSQPGGQPSGPLGAPPSSGEPLPPAPQRPGVLASPQLDQYQTPGVQPITPAPTARPVEVVPTPAEQAVERSAAAEMAATSPNPPAQFKLIRPVRGPVVTHFNQGFGRTRNDGIDFASPSDSPVLAAASGEVALVSQALGGLGTIVLLRHPDDYLTVYGRLDRVSVVKGDIVNRGQRIGVVSPSPQPRMHFEVRQGAESLDPELFF